MEAPYATRKQQLLAECQVAPEIFPQVMPRLETCMAPFVRTFCRQEPVQHAHTSVFGLLADLERKNVASIAYRFGQDRLPLHRFVGWAEWDEVPLRQELRHQVAQHWGQADGVLVVDPAAFPKSGTDSVGVARQWCGRLGKVANGQVAVSLGDVSGEGHTLGDMRLSLPKTWTQDKARLDQAGGPTDRSGDRARHPLALDMLEPNGPSLPHAWVAGDDEMGRPYWFRRRLDRLGERVSAGGPWEHVDACSGGGTADRQRQGAPPAASVARQRSVGPLAARRGLDHHGRP